MIDPLEEKDNKKLEEVIKERLHVRPDKLVCHYDGLCRGYGYALDDGQSIYVKTNKSLNASIKFNGEFSSLRSINATKTLKVPKEIIVIENIDDEGTPAIVMEFLEFNHMSAERARKLGQDLANLHDYNNKLIRYEAKASRWVGKQIPSTTHIREDMQNKSEDDSEEENDEIQFSKHSMKLEKSKDEKQRNESENLEYANRFVPQPNTESVSMFGFNVPTSCQLMPQINEWTGDWVSFFARHRLDASIRSMIEYSNYYRELNELWSELQLKVDKLFVDFDYRGSRKGEIIPALLHGDLSYHHSSQLSDSSDVLVYDPASFYGHSEYEFGMVRMFDQFPSEFEEAYFELMPKRKLFEKRNKLYQLFHHLNYWNTHGLQYGSNSVKLMKDILKSIN